jgi:hypothetical protein
VDNVYNLQWTETMKYGDVYHQNEVEQSTYNFEHADVDFLFHCFEQYEKEAQHLLALEKPLPPIRLAAANSAAKSIVAARFGRNMKLIWGWGVSTLLKTTAGLCRLPISTLILPVLILANQEPVKSRIC